MLSIAPDLLWVQTHDGRLNRLAETEAGRAAQSIAEDADPESTDYSRSCRAGKYRQDGADGAKVIAGLLLTDPKSIPAIQVAVNQVGQVVIVDGLHRAAAALAAHRPLAVHLVYRAEQWIAFRHALMAIEGEPKLYQPIGHPDLDWPAWRRDTPERVAIIAAELRAAHAVSIVDFACHVGVLSCGVARHGFDVMGIDSDPKVLRAAWMLRGMDAIGSNRARFMFGFRPAGGPYDAAICLSLLNHHLVDGRADEAADIACRLTACAPLVILDAPSPGDPVGGDSEWTDPASMGGWFCEAVGGGSWSLLAPASETLQRPLLRWRP